MNTTALASALAGFLIGGLVASAAASLDDAPGPADTPPVTSTTSGDH